MQTFSAVPTFEEWRSQYSAYSHSTVACTLGGNVHVFDTPVDSGNIIDYLAFLGSILDGGGIVPEEVLDAIAPEMVYLLASFAPPGSLNYYSTHSLRLQKT